MRDVIILIVIGWLAAAYALGFILAAAGVETCGQLTLRALQRLRAWVRDRRALLWDEFAFRVIKRATRRPPDFIVGGAERPYLRRWWLLPRNRVINVYLHHFLRDDDDRALHDHPWDWCSILLDGSYIEHTIDAGGIHRRRERREGSIKLSRAERAHRIELVRGRFGPRSCWTLFITGPRRREWGFHCAQQGWIDWRRFVNPSDIGQAGPGCDA